MQELALGSRVEQERVTAEGERPIKAKLMLGLVMRLPPCHIMILNIKLLTASTQRAVSFCYLLTEVSCKPVTCLMHMI